MAELASLPNVYTKMSGLFHANFGVINFIKKNGWPAKLEVFDLAYPLITSCFYNALALIGSCLPQNFPMDSVSTSLVNIIDAFSDAIAVSHPEALSLIFRGHAKQFYRL